VIITEKDAWMTDSLDKQRREYVISRTRDGKVMENKPLGDVGYHVRRGGTAYRRGDERWANPYEGGRARAWTYGWERAHTTEKGAACKGCKRCGLGTALPAPTYGEWYRQWKQKAMA